MRLSTEKKIYADNAATTKLDQEVLDAMMPWLTEEYANASQPYSFARKPRQALNEARCIIASCINAEPESILFTSGGTEADNWVVKNPAMGSHHSTILTSEIEHHAVLNACRRIEECENAAIHYLHVDKTGIVLEEELKQKVTGVRKNKTAKDYVLTSIMMANNEIGTVEPIKELAAIAHARESLFHTDAVQALGHIPVDVKELGVDYMSASAHKFNGPKGVGFLYVKKGAPICSHNDGGGQEFGLRAGTENVAGIVGMATALKNNCDSLEKNMAYVSMLEERLISGLKSLDYIRNGALQHIPGNINISFRQVEGEALLHLMDLKGICISTGAACDSIHTQVSHVIKAIGVRDDYANGTIRISLGKNNTVEEVDEIVAALKQVVSYT